MNNRKISGCRTDAAGNIVIEEAILGPAVSPCSPPRNVTPKSWPMLLG